MTARIIKTTLDLRDHPEITIENAIQVAEDAFKANIQVEMFVVSIAQKRAWDQELGRNGYIATIQGSFGAADVSLQAYPEDRIR